jgi:predicted transcriptional regulator
MTFCFFPLLFKSIFFSLSVYTYTIFKCIHLNIVYNRHIYIVSQNQELVSTIRVSSKVKSRLAIAKARLTIKEGKERSMDELIDLLLDVYEGEPQDKMNKRLKDQFDETQDKMNKRLKDQFDDIYHKIDREGMMKDLHLRLQKERQNTEKNIEEGVKK